MLKRIINKIRFLHDPIGFCRTLGVTIGEDCSIMGTKHPFGSEPYLIIIGNHVRINDGVQFITHDGGVWVIRHMQWQNQNVSDIDLFGKITIGDNVQIGSRAIIMPGVTIGSNVIIGAGAIVTRSIPSNSVAVGVPARPIETIQQYYEKNINKCTHTKFMNQDEKRSFLVDLFSK